MISWCHLINPFKGVNVSYAPYEKRPTLYIPVEESDFEIGGGMNAPVWQKYSWVEEACPFLSTEEPLLIRFKCCRRGQFLYFCFYMPNDGGQVVAREGWATADIWKCDMAELHFGGIEPEAWHLQMALNCTGNRFDSKGMQEKWQAATFIDDNGWGAEVKIDMDILLSTDGGMRFNICRMSLGHGSRQYSTWSRMTNAFHTVSEFGELLLVDYDTAMMLRFNQFSSGMTREEYQKTADSGRIPAWTITHGPSFTNPQPGKITVSWTTAGRSVMALEWKKVGKGEEKSRKFSSVRNGRAAAETFHSVDLEGLEPDKIYACRMVTPRSWGGYHKSCWFKFAAPPVEEKDFSFFIVTDIHSDVDQLTKCLKGESACSAEFLVNLGDHLSQALGTDALFSAVVDPVARMSSVYEKERVHRPCIYLRGNHEWLGIHAGDYGKVMRFTNGHTWQTFTWRGVFFLVLDSGAEQPDYPGRPHFMNTAMLREETEFLREVAASEEYRSARWRIAFMHMPPVCSQTQKKPQHYTMMKALQGPGSPPLDMMFCGHEHRYGRLEAGKTILAESSEESYCKRCPSARPLRFPVTVLGNHDVAEVTVGADKLSVKVGGPNLFPYDLKDSFETAPKK